MCAASVRSGRTFIMDDERLKTRQAVETARSRGMRGPAAPCTWAAMAPGTSGTSSRDRCGSPAGAHSGDTGYRRTPGRRSARELATVIAYTVTAPSGLICTMHVATRDSLTRWPRGAVDQILLQPL